MDTAAFFDGLRAINGNERRPQFRDLISEYLKHDYADAEGRARYFSSDATFEDPAGATPLNGREAILLKFKEVVASGIRSTVEVRQIISSGNEAVVVGDASVTVKGTAYLDVDMVLYIRVNADLQILEFKAFFDEGSARPAGQ